MSDHDDDPVKPVPPPRGPIDDEVPGRLGGISPREGARRPETLAESRARRAALMAELRQRYAESRARWRPKGSI